MLVAIDEKRDKYGFEPTALRCNSSASIPSSLDGSTGGRASAWHSKGFWFKSRSRI